MGHNVIMNRGRIITGGNMANGIGSVLPGFVLALRDFSLKLVKDGSQITPDAYLVESLESKTGKDVFFNKPRECIRKFFPQDKRRCFAFPAPGDIDIVENLERLTLQDLSKRFQKITGEFVSYIYCQKPKQLQVSKPVNGSNQFGTHKLDLQMEMNSFWQELQNQNEEEIEKYCLNVLNGLTSYNNLQAELQNKGYEVIGGHRKFKRQVEMARKEYEQALNLIMNKERLVSFGEMLPTNSVSRKIKSLKNTMNFLMKKEIGKKKKLQNQ
ncbi:GBP1-like protein [Mya arenaria]|uniref:GBP1-like protein n=1 Tax=Mya arenaria TaxID=6604 RepID=A0ABY7EXM3_MYAAR|nr:GBP1-like protein [Mya arenaria]